VLVVLICGGTEEVTGGVLTFGVEMRTGGLLRVKSRCVGGVHVSRRGVWIERVASELRTLGTGRVGGFCDGPVVSREYFTLGPTIVVSRGIRCIYRRESGVDGETGKSTLGERRVVSLADVWVAILGMGRGGGVRGGPVVRWTNILVSCFRAWIWESPIGANRVLRCELERAAVSSLAALMDTSADKVVGIL